MLGSFLGKNLETKTENNLHIFFSQLKNNCSSIGAQITIIKGHCCTQLFQPMKNRFISASLVVSYGLPL